MQNNYPLGALSEKQKQNMRFSHTVENPGPRIYLVSRTGIESGNVRNFMFNSVPPMHYFTNYWHAYAYSLKLKRAEHD